MFSESLVARRVPVTAELLSAFVGLLMSPKSCGCQEGLSTILPVANMVSLLRMSTFCVVRQMRLSQKGFVTVGFRTFEGLLPSMRTNVFF